MSTEIIDRYHTDNPLSSTNDLWLRNPAFDGAMLRGRAQEALWESQSSTRPQPTETGIETPRIEIASNVSETDQVAARNRRPPLVFIFGGHEGAADIPYLTRRGAEKSLKNSLRQETKLIPGILFHRHVGASNQR